MTRRRLARPALAVLTGTIELLAFAWPAVAVPIPWRNCGSRSDTLIVQQLNASIWPPRGTPAPLQATPFYDPATGALRSLTIDLLLGPDWVFDTGPLAAPVVGGFVTLPSSIPLTLMSPTLPIPAGPVNITQTLTSSNPGSQPIIIQSKAAVGQPITSVNATLSLTWNGSPGFPVPASSGLYHATVQANESGGQEIFCFDFTPPNSSFVEVPATATTLASAPNASAFGQPVTLTAAVTSPSGTPAGDVAFYDGATLLGTAAVDPSGQAAFTTSFAAGAHNLTATFDGNGGFSGSTSTSPVLMQTAIVPTPALDDRALFLLAIALAAIGALLLRRSL